MTSASPGDDDTPRTGAPRRQPFVPCLGVFVVWLAYSAVCRPVPAANEPHYLTKARHYWQPDWCAGDFFLESSNPHGFFYQTIGALTNWLTLAQSAWVGRVVVLGLLAWGWTRLLSRLSEHRGLPLLAAALFLVLQSLGNLSGEWLVGGVESKVPAYALAFLGWSFLIDNRAALSGVCLGLAVSWHPVVGGWCIIAAGMALLAGRIRRESHGPEQCLSGTKAGWLGLMALVLCAIPGIVPALETLSTADPQAAATADRYQVGTRLAHHLDPLAFPLSAYRYYALLMVLGLLLTRRTPSSPARLWFLRLVGAAVLIALAGVLIGWGPRPLGEMPLADMRIRLLKFYPFRLADLLVPMYVAVALGESIVGWWITRATPTEPSLGQLSESQQMWGLGLITIVAMGLALWIPHPDKRSSRMSPAKEADWRAACDWIFRETPANSLLYAANEDWAVKWFCQRPEFVNYKDCPQDAAGILEWARRLKELNRWHREAYRDGRIAAEELQSLHTETGITHLLVSRLGPIAAEPVYHNDSFRVYRIAGGE